MNLIIRSIVILLTIIYVKTDENQFHSFHMNKKCSLNRLMDNMFESLTPEDYSQANHSVVYQRVNHINETIDRFIRLKNFAEKLRNTYEPIVQRLSARMSEVLMEIDLPNDCLSSLVNIMSGIRDNKKWALQCKHYF